MGNQQGLPAIPIEGTAFTKDLVGTKYRTLTTTYLLILVNDPAYTGYWISPRIYDFKRQEEVLAVELKPGLEFEITQLPGYIISYDLHIKVKILKDHVVDPGSKVTFFDLGGLGDQNCRYEHSTCNEIIPSTLEGLLARKSDYFISRLEELQMVLKGYKISVGTELSDVCMLFDESESREVAVVNSKYYEKL